MTRNHSSNKSHRKDKDLPLFGELHQRAKKAGQLPGTPMYTGKEISSETKITLLAYVHQQFKEIIGSKFEDCFPLDKSAESIWVNIEGLNNISLIEQIAQYFKLHPLTVEDILNVEQRPKIEEFDQYIFVTLKVLFSKNKPGDFTIKQISFILGNNFVLSFQEIDTTLFDPIHDRLKNNHYQSRQQRMDYLIYRLIDAIVDEYFIVLEGIGDDIEKIEDLIVASPTVRKERTIYRLKRQMLMLRKVIWPVREVLNHLLHIDNPLIAKSTTIYLRDVYDHIVQGIDTLETFRDMLSSLLDMYLSSLSQRLNEIMKTLTIISTIFIPITAIGSIYGMNFVNLPGLHWHYGYLIALVLMLIIASIMIVYFYRKKWI